MAIGKDLGFPFSKRKPAPDNSLVLPECCLGLEFEFEGVTQLPDQSAEWAELVANKEDGSLRNNGQEFLFARPLFGKDALDAINGICDTAEKLKYVTSLRTGLHVHVDARDIEYDDLQRWIILNALLEPALYHWAGDNRDENVFCLPWYRTTGLLKNLRKIYSADANNIRRRCEDLRSSKYSGMNLDPLSRFGSIEYRHLHCTKDKARILKWVNICLRLKEAALRFREQPADIVKKSNDVGVWRTILAQQYDDLYYDNFLQDIRLIGVAVASAVIKNNADGGFSNRLKIGENKRLDALLKKKKAAQTTAGVLMDEVPPVFNPNALQAARQLFHATLDGVPAPAPRAQPAPVPNFLIQYREMVDCLCGLSNVNRLRDRGPWVIDDEDIVNEDECKELCRANIRAIVDIIGRARPNVRTWCRTIFAAAGVRHLREQFDIWVGEEE